MRVYEEDLYDCHIFTLLCTGPRAIHVLLLVESTQVAFSKLLANLLSAFNENISFADSLFLCYCTIVLHNRDLSDFYAQIEHSETILPDLMPDYAFFTPKFRFAPDQCMNFVTH
jgi:hypothetical protein